MPLGWRSRSSRERRSSACGLSSTPCSAPWGRKTTTRTSQVRTSTWAFHVLFSLSPHTTAPPLAQHAAAALAPACQRGPSRAWAFRAWAFHGTRVRIQFEPVLTRLSPHSALAACRQQCTSAALSCTAFQWVAHAAGDHNTTLHNFPDLSWLLASPLLCPLHPCPACGPARAR